MLETKKEGYPAKAVANYFLELATKENKPLDHLKLQKLIYFAHGWHLALTKKPLIKEDIEAWRYGPVIPVIYEEFKRFSSSPITEYATEINRYTGEILVLKLEAIEKTTDIVDKVWEEYGNCGASELVRMSHMKGSPWDQVWRACYEFPALEPTSMPHMKTSMSVSDNDIIIKNPMILKYFSKNRKGNTDG